MKSNMNKKEYMKIYWEKHPAQSKINRQRFLVKNPEYAKNWRKMKQDLVDKLKSAPCTDCNQSYLPCQMDFDHRPNEIKIDDINHLVWRKEEILLAEIAKCDLVCANCHRLRTWKRRKEKTEIIEE